MNKVKLIVLLIGILCCSYATAEDIKDAFVLIDVSGTMKNATANSEAQSIILQMLSGNFKESDWSGHGWKRTRSDDTFPTTPFMSNGSHLCIIPFGDMKRVHDRAKYVYSSNEEMASFFNQNYPTSFRDKLTYLTLAKAYVGSVAVTDNIPTAYVFIYTDGQPESTNEPYNQEDLQRTDDLEHAGSNSFQKIGCLRKSLSNKIKYDVEVWKFKKYSTIKITVKPDTPIVQRPDSIVDPPITPKFNIIFPENAHNSKKAYGVDVEEEFEIKWTGGIAQTISISKKEGERYTPIPANKAKELYKLVKRGTFAKLTFYESGDYKVNVSGKNGNDSIYVSASSDPMDFLLPLILVILAIVGGVYAYKEYVKPKPIDPNNGGNGSRSDSFADKNDDW